jgi:hypothetical protein
MSRNELGTDEYRRGFVRAIASLNDAVREAGGPPITVEQMEEMSLMDFMVTVAAPNKIRFKYVDRNKQRGT